MAKKKLPKVLALLDEDMCTGCEACLSVCPVDCISTVPGPRHEAAFQVCTIDLPRCIGCTLCHQIIPGKLGLTELGNKLTHLHLGCVDIEKTLANRR